MHVVKLYFGLSHSVFLQDDHNGLRDGKANHGCEGNADSHRLQRQCDFGNIRL